MSAVTATYPGPMGPVEMRENPGVWGRIAVTGSRRSASVTASQIRNGTRVVWAQPRGTFETYWEATPEGYVVYARYVGVDGPR